MDKSTVRLWPCWEPLAVGVLPVPPAKLGIRYLRKVSAYLWARAQDGVLPRLTWSLWRRVACAKLQLPEHTAWVYFEVFDSLSPEFTVTDRLERAEQLSQCSNERELEAKRAMLSVDTLTFLLFLLVQQTQRVSLRSSLHKDDSWPDQGPSMPDDDRLVTQNKVLDDRHHLSFILSSFSEALRLLLPPDETSLDGLAPVACLSHQAVKALDLLVEGRASPMKNVLGLSILAALPGQRDSSGWLGPSQGFAAKSLEFWTRSRLGANPCSLSSCVQYGRQLSWAEHGRGTTKQVRVAFCSHSGSKVLLLSDLSGQTVARSSARLTGAHVVLHRCSSAYIYLLSPMRSVTLNRCRRLQLVLGPVETSVRLCGCREVTVAAACRRLGIISSSSCTLHLLTPSRPLVFTGNEGLKFAPLHVYYPLLEEHMAYCGLASIPNLWDKPLCFGIDKCSHSESGTKCQPMPYGLLPPDDLHPLSVPFAMSGLTSEIPGGLPKIYQKALDRRQRRIQSWEGLVREAKLTREQRTALKDSVEQTFYTWLQKMGFKQQLDSLLASGAPADKT
uniref:TBCC domain-containing protein 1-like isoform X1 n=2 Tax=Myxine glutinosa TaxID=7769 RepID=UPI00358E6A17